VEEVRGGAATGGAECSPGVKVCESRGLARLPGQPGERGRAARPRALFPPAGTPTGQATCTDVEGNFIYLFIYFSPGPRQALPFPQLVTLVFPRALHISGRTREREMTVWLNNSDGLRVKKLGGETGCEVEHEVTGGRELIDSAGFPR